jgi:fatty-acyl-CoA synthase
MKMTGTDWIAKWAGYHPDKVAIKEPESGRELTYSEFNAAANYAAEWLRREHKVRKGDRIALLSENSLEAFVLFSAAQKLGFILVPLNYRLTHPEIAHLLSDCDPKVVFFEATFASLLSNVRIPILPAETIMTLPSPPAGNMPAASLSTDDPLFILYTSGTTGTPKGAVYTHGMLFWNAVNTAMRLDIHFDDRAVSCTPMFHTGGWNVIPTPFLHRGASFTLLRNFDASVVNRLLEQEKSTMFMAVPTMLKLMAEAENFAATDFSHLRFFIIGGEAMPLPLIDTWHQKSVPVRQGYGLTECGPSITSLHQADAIRKKGSIGTLNFHLEMQIVDDNDQPVEIGQSGELLLSGPVVTPGYWRNESETTKAFLNQQWFRTGDVVEQDAEGYLYIVDRLKHMYISGGENVYPAEVERQLLQHPQITECAIVAQPDAKWGESGHAFYAAASGTALAENELREFCRERLAKYKIPKNFTHLAALPKTATGKTDRKTIQHSFINRRPK